MDRAVETDLLRPSDRHDHRPFEIAMERSEPGSLAGTSKSDRASPFDLVAAHIVSWVCSMDAADLNRMDAV
jgi:hypothetical protein